MQRKSSNINPFPLPFGLMQSVMLPGSKTVPSPIHSTPKLPHTRLTSIRSHPSLHSNSLAVMLSLIYKDQTKLSLVNVQLTAYTLALLRKREHICSTAMSRGSCLNHRMSNLRRWKVENKSQLTWIARMRLLMMEVVIQGGPD